LRAEKIAPHIRVNDTVLEYGVGFGWNLAALNCSRRIGLDPAEFLEPAVRRQGIEFITEPAALADGSLDVILCHHVLEHVWQPTDLLGTAYRLLHPGGRLLLFVPYEKESRFHRFDPNELNHHLYSWNPQTLGNLVTDAGFEVVSAGLGRFGQERFAAIWACRWHLGETGFRTLRWLANTLKREREVRVVATKAGNVSSGRIIPDVEAPRRIS
jgi:SAM-dependent methyltransferase